MSKKVKIIAIIASVIILGLAGYISYHLHFKYEWAYDRMMKSPETIDKSREMTKAELLYNLGIIAEREGLQLSYPKWDLTIGYYDKSTRTWEKAKQSGDLPEGKSGLFYSLNGRYTAGQKKPREIRFIMQVMLFTRDRNLGEYLHDFAGISGDYSFHPNKDLGKSYEACVTVEEFEKIYNRYNVDALPHESRVEFLTHAWIYRTGYNRPGIHPKYRFISPDINEYIK